jgi:SAM-dependent methyltransferase
MPHERDYVLGTHDQEIERLGLQHRVWRPRALEAWRRAGFRSGQTIVDVGSGPGFATMDLAEIVGPTGRVVAIERSRRFLDHAETLRTQRRLDWIRTFEQDLDEGRLPDVQADGAWARWVFAFVKRPRDLLVRVRDLLKVGATFVVHEYFDYATWRLAPRLPEQEEFVGYVEKAWRASGGEPDIGLDLPSWMEELGFEIRHLLPIVDVIDPSTFAWQWPKSFVEIGLQRFVELGTMTAERAQAIRDAFHAREASPHARMITPSVLEIVATRR